MNVECMDIFPWELAWSCNFEGSLPLSNSQEFDYFGDFFFEKTEFWEVSKRHFWKKTRPLFRLLELSDFFQEWRLLSSRKNIFLKFMTTYSGSLDFFSEKTLTHFPKFGVNPYWQIMENSSRIVPEIFIFRVVAPAVLLENSSIKNYVLLTYSVFLYEIFYRKILKIPDLFIESSLP